MAVCSWCKGEMSDFSRMTCSGNLVVEFPDGETLAAVPYRFDGDDGDLSHRCHDCNIALGGHHHPGCDMERCPRCGGQLIGCGCLDEEEG